MNLKQMQIPLMAARDKFLLIFPRRNFSSLSQRGAGNKEVDGWKCAALQFYTGYVALALFCSTFLCELLLLAAKTNKVFNYSSLIPLWGVVHGLCLSVVTLHRMKLLRFYLHRSWPTNQSQRKIGSWNFIVVGTLLLGCRYQTYTEL